MMSDSFMIRRSSPSMRTSVPDHLPNSTRSPALTSSGLHLAALVAGARSDGDDLALLGLLLGGVGNDDPALGLLFRLDAADDDAVVQRTKLHRRLQVDLFDFKENEAAERPGSKIPLPRGIRLALSDTQEIC